MNLVCQVIYIYENVIYDAVGAFLEPSWLTNVLYSEQFICKVKNI